MWYLLKYPGSASAGLTRAPLGESVAARFLLLQFVLSSKTDAVGLIGYAIKRLQKKQFKIISPGVPWFAIYINLSSQNIR